jgi:hypothetical protein
VGTKARMNKDAMVIALITLAVSKYEIYKTEDRALECLYQIIGILKELK